MMETEEEVRIIMILVMRIVKMVGDGGYDDIEVIVVIIMMAVMMMMV